MATQTEATGQGDRGVVVGSLLVLLAAAAMGFGRVFQGGSTTLRLAGVALAAVGLAALLRRRHLLLSIGASVAGLLVTVGIVVFPHTTFFGLPSSSTVGEVIRSFGRLSEQAAQEIAPAPPLPSLMTASIIAVWTAGTAAHALAVRSKSAILALLPPASLLGFAGVVTERGPTALATAGFLVGALGVVFGVGVGRLALWGPLVPWSGRRRHLVRGATGRWAARLGLIAVVASLLLPGLLPGYRAGPVLTFEPGAVSRVAISPIVDIGPSLLQNPPADLFTVEADRPAYWRLLSLDEFNGQLWTSSNVGGSGGRVVTGVSPLAGSGAPGEPLVQDYEIAGLAVPWLPAAFEPTHVALDIQAEAGASVRHDPDSSMLVRADKTQRGYRYGVVSEIVEPSARALDRAYEPIDTGLFRVQNERYLALPSDLPPGIAQFARQVSAGERTPFRQLLAIQERLRSFRYDVHAPPGHGSNHILNFLTETRQGFCEQFAGAFAVLARTLGYPARVAVGFTPGTRDRTGRYAVTTAEAHAWPEVLFPGHGWVAFEPTPTRSNPVANRYLNPVRASNFPGIQGGPGAGAIDPSRARTAQREAFEKLREGRNPGGSAEPERRLSDRLRSTVTVVLALAILAAGALLVMAIGKPVVRRMAVGRARTAREGVVAAYRAFLGSAADLGLARRSTETPWEYQDRLRGHVAFSDGHLERLTGLAGRALYAADGLTRGEAREAAGAERALARDLRRHAGVTRSVVAAVRPSRPLP
ncbi:MAG: transglutaminase TgpA family protein [Actinomycetota bacterium]